MKTQTFADAVATGKRCAVPSGCYGRIVSTRADTPEILSDDLDRRAVMVMGPTGLHRMTGASAQSMLRTVGHTQDYIAHKQRQGYRFFLVVFKRTRALRIATWRNVLATAGQVYPEASSLISSTAKVVSTTPLSCFERAAGFNFAAVDKLGADDERFMTLNRLLASDGSPLAVRRFLFHVLRLNSLYTGNGFTATETGGRGVREYIGPNYRLAELEDCSVIRLRFE